MTVNELRARLEQLVAEDPTVGELDVCATSPQADGFHVMSATVETYADGSRDVELGAW